MSNITDGQIDFNTAKFISEDTYAELTRRCQIEHGDVLYTTVGSYGNAALVRTDDRFAFQRHIAHLKPNRDKIEPRFLAAILSSTEVRRQVDNVARGVAQKTVNLADLKNIQIIVPPMHEQRRIAEILDKIEALRAKRRKVIAKHDEFLRALFMTTFGDPAINPKSWPVGPLGKLLNSATYGTSEKADHTGKTPILRMGNLTTSGDIVLNDLKYIDLSKPDDDRYLVKRGDILFNRTNSAELVGKTAVFHGDEPMAYAGYLVRLRTNERAHPEYISAVLNSKYGKAVLRGMCKSIVGMANINAKEVQTIPIPHPPVDLQRSFAAQVTQVRTMKGLQQAALNKLDVLFASLQHRAFRGGL